MIKQELIRHFYQKFTALLDPLHASLQLLDIGATLNLIFSV